MQGDLVPPLKAQRDEIVVTVILLVAALLLVGLPTVIVAVLCYQYLYSQRSRQEYLVFLLVSVVGASLVAVNAGLVVQAVADELRAGLLLIAHLVAFQDQATISFTPILKLSVLTLPLSPSLGAALWGARFLQKRFPLYRTIEDWLSWSQERDLARQREETQRAMRQAMREPCRYSSGKLYIGTQLHGEPLPKTANESIGIHQHGRWTTLDDRVLNEHMFLLGATGAGKSTALLRLCHEVLRHTDRDLIIVDGKGEEQLAQDIRTLVWKYRRQETPIFRLGGLQSGARYHAFCGHQRAIYNRLLKMIDDGKAEGGATYYLDKNRNLLQLICAAPEGPPRSFVELRGRLSLDWLRSAYAGSVEELSYITSRDAQDMASLSERMLPLIREFQEATCPEGFTLEDTRTAVFSIKTLSVGDTAQRFCRFLVEDFKDFVSNRAKRPGMLGIDEFGEFGNDNIKALLSQARSQEYGVVLLTQEYANLGDNNLARQILANTRTKFLMGTDYPEELGAPAGTKYQVESSVQSNELGLTGMMSGRIQHAFKVDMNTVRRFAKGQSFIIRNGYAVAVQISPVVISAGERAAVPKEPVSTPDTTIVPSVTGITSIAEPKDNSASRVQQLMKRKKNRVKL